MLDKNRRKLMKSISAAGSVSLAGVSVPKTWSRPVIESVLLTAHAETSSDSGSLPGTNPTTPPPCLTSIDSFGVAIRGLCDLVTSNDGGIGTVIIRYTSSIGITSYSIAFDSDQLAWAPIDDGSPIGDPTSGTLTQAFCLESNKWTGMDITVTLTQSDGGVCDYSFQYPACCL